MEEISNTEKSLIEVWFPVLEVSEEAKKEKPGRAPTFELHFWWTRKPLIVSRATVLGALLPASFDKSWFLRLLGSPPCEEGRAYNYSLENTELEMLQEIYYKRWNSKQPTVLDSMAGGGSIPFEATRVGCKAIAIEYNPVAYLILKATIEYPQRYGLKLAGDVQKWGYILSDRVKKKMEKFYPNHNGREVYAYLWYRAVQCPRCGSKVPLAAHWWLSRKKKLALQPFVAKDKVSSKVIRRSQVDFDPSNGTIRQAIAKCLKCLNVISGEHLKNSGKQDKIEHLLLVTITTSKEGKTYESPTLEDFDAIDKVNSKLRNSWNEYLQNDLICNEKIPLADFIRSKTLDTRTLGATWSASAYLRPPIYGLGSWDKLFNLRQLLTHITFVQEIRNLRDIMFEEFLARNMKADEAREYTRAVMTCLALTFDKLINYNSSLTLWNVNRETVSQTFSYRGLTWSWNYVEVNPFSDGSGTWSSCLKTVVESIKFSARCRNSVPTTLYGSATKLPFQDESIPILIVDPPYYADVPYGELSDFCYVWLKRILKEEYPELFRTSLVPKEEEVDYCPGRHGSEDAARAVYEALLRRSLEEIERVLQKNGIAIIIFAHSATQAWEGIIKVLLESGLVATATWPVHTETTAGVLRDRAFIASSILIICRKVRGKTSAWFEEVRHDLRNRVWEELSKLYDKYKLWGADLFIASIGPAIRTFGQYSSIKSYTGEEVPISKVLDEMRNVVAEYVFERLANEPGIASKVDVATRFYVVAKWVYSFKDKDGNWKTVTPFDEARKLALSLGTSVDLLEVAYGIVRKKGAKVFIMGPLERTHERIISLSRPKANSLVDAVHLAALAYRSGGREASSKILSELGLRGAPEIRAVAQALLQALPPEDEEHKLIAQFLMETNRYEIDTTQKERITLDKFFSS